MKIDFNSLLASPDTYTTIQSLTVRDLLLNFKEEDSLVYLIAYVFGKTNIT